MKLPFLAFSKKTSIFLNILLFLLVFTLSFALFLRGEGQKSNGSGAENLSGGSIVDGSNESIFSGSARVTDGDSIRFGAESIRLLGLDAPEIEQTCIDPNGQIWTCGQAARQRLEQLMAQGRIECRSQKRDRYDRSLAICTVNGLDVGSVLVSEGLAVSYYDYQDQENEARSNKLGMWAGEFVTPRNWRRGER